MRKGIMKRTAALMLAAAMMISMAGCGKSGDGSKKDGSKEETKDTKEMVYAGEDLVLEGLKGDLSNVLIEGDKMYISTYEWVEDDKAAAGEDADAGDEDTTESEGADTGDGDAAESEGADNGDGDTAESEGADTGGEDTTTEEGTSEEAGEGSEADADSEDAESDEEEKESEGTSTERLYCANLDGSDLKEITLPERNENEWMNYVYPTQEGTFIYLYSSYDEKKEMSLYSIVQADENGKVSVKEDVTETLKLDNETYISKMLMDEKGNLVFVMNNAIFVLDGSGKLVCELKAENNVWLDGAAKTKDGQIVVGYAGENGACIQTVDIEGKKWGEKYDVDVQYFNGSDSLMNGMGDYDIYYKDDSGVYGYTLAGKKSTKIIDYMASNISSENSYNMVPFTEGRFLCNTWDENGSKLIVYSKVDPSTIKDKQAISIAMMWVDDEVKKAAMEFNQNSDKYQIEIKDYSNEEDPVTKMNADIIAGNVADIICLNELPTEQYVSKGLLEDLTPYIEKDDEINPDDIVDSLREAMEIDGKLYYVVPSFSVSTLTAATADVGTEMGWTFEDLKKLLDEKGEGVRPFWSESKEQMLYSFAGNATSDFVDWATGECSFDSQDFKDILELCNTGTDEEPEYNEDSPSMPSLIREGKVLFNEGGIDLESIQMYKKMFNGGITFIGYPDAEKEGSYFSLSSNLGIYSKSKVKEGAWEFIRIFMTKDYQCKQVSSGYMYNMPSRKDAIEFKNKIAMTTETFKDEYGVEHAPADGTWGWDDLEVQIKPSSQEDIDMYMDLINNTKKIGGWNQAILDIIIEESKAYFSGDKSLDETADIIQNRVKTYVNENR